MRLSSIVASAALIGSGLALAAPAAALPLAEVPPSAADWATTPYSPLQPGEIAAAGNTAVLEFDGTGGGLHAGGDVDTGFTMIQPSSAVNPTAPSVLLDTEYYLPSNLSVAGGNLDITATKGIAFEKWASTTPGNTDQKNRQDNTLGVGIDPGTSPLRLQTTIANPAGIYGAAQGGVWLGADDDNFFKVAFMGTASSASDTVRQVQIKREIAGVTSSAAANEINVALNGVVGVGQAVTLYLEVNPVTLKAAGSYQIGGGAVTPIGTMDVPASFLDGSLLSSAAPEMPGVDTFGGVFATKRNMPEATPVTFSFSRFAVAELDTTAPAAPGGVTAASSTGANELTWSAPADTDVVGYRVYRSATSGAVAPTGANLISGASPVTATSFADQNVFVGQTWNYSVYAVDASGNVSPDGSTSATTPAPAGEPVVKVDFTTPAGSAEPGYEKDSGAAYSDETGSGWITADDGAPFDFSLNTRIRAAGDGVTDPRLLSLIHLQYGTSGNAQSPPNPSLGITVEEGVWEREVPNGRYNVLVAAGDTSNGNFDSSHNVVVEGEDAVSQFVGSLARPFAQGVAEVEVLDGKLTVAPTNGDNTKIAFLEIYELELFGPDAPADFTAALGEDAESVELGWQAVDGATGYNVYRSEVSPVDTATEPLNAEPLTETSFIDDTVTLGATYFYTVVALGDGIPNSAPATEASVLVPSAPVEPTAPADVTASAGEQDITVTWGAVEGAVGYKVYRGTSTPVSVEGEAHSGVDALTTTSYVDATAVPGIEYHYVVVALGAEDFVSAPSASVSATVEETTAPGECVVSEWSGTYFDGTNLQGAPVATDCVADLDFSHSGDDAPMAGVSPVNYSARFVKTIDEGAGNYTFTARADDGVRVFVDGEPVIDRWSYSTEPVVATVALEAGPHVVTVEYFQGWGGAQLSLDYAVSVDECVVSEWSGTYFDGTNLQGAPVATDCVADLDFSHSGDDAPMAGVSPVNYSARFVKTIDEGAGNYTFTARADDGVRVFVDGEPVIDRWSYSTEPVVATVALEAGPHVVTVEYFQGWGGAQLSLDYAVSVDECVVSEWSGTYFDGTNLQGAPVASACLTELSEEHGYDVSPVAGVSPVNYSARFVKTIDEGAGNYTFTARADDGVRVFVDGEPVIDRWSYSTEPVVATVALEAGPHVVTVEYFQGWGGAQLSLDYAVSVDECVVSEWSGTYFDGTNLQGAPVATDCVADLDFSHSGDDAPMAGVSPVNYSARFVKTIDEGAGNYTFTARADDGVRVFVDGEPVIDRWSYSTEPVVATVALEAGPHVVTVEYFQGWGGALLSLDYEREGADIEAPAAPTALRTAQQDETIALEWDASTSTDTVGYNVYRSTSAGVTASTGEKLNLTPVSAAAFTDDSVVLDTQYYYVVTAIDAAGNESAESNEATGIAESTPDTEAPEAPAGLEATGGDATVSLTWDASVSADTVGYHVYRGIQPGAVGLGELVSGEAPVTETAFIDDTVLNGTTYFYEVIAVDLAGNESAPSNEAIVAPRVPNTTDIKVDFTATNAVPVAGYVADWGQAYGERTGVNQGTGLTYGWVDSDGHELSLVGNGRDRGRAGVPELVDSVMHMQYGDVAAGGNGVTTPGAWEIEVADGVYEVTFAVGDQPGADDIYDSLNVINVEGSAALEEFQQTPGEEYRTTTTTVGVFDGRLTIDALGGTNTKIGYVTITGVPFDRPVIERPLPLNRALDADVNGGVSATIKTAYAGFGIDPATMQGNIKLFKVSDGAEVAGTSQTSGGSDTMNFSPDLPLEPNTKYRYVVTEGVKDYLGNAWLPFTSVFTTAPEIVDPGDPGQFTPLTNIAFDKVELPIAAGRFWASMAFGPDGKLYGSTIGQGIFRYTVNADGTLSNEENLGYAGEAMVGFLFDKSATAGNLKLWITHTTANTGSESDEWASGVSLLTGQNLENRKRVFTQLPRSLRDHLTNSMVYGPNDDIYVLQGSNTAAGDGDGSWGARGEKLLTAALLHFDPDHPRVQQSIASAQGNDPLNVRTDGVADPYNPYAADAALKIYATGIRNAYDLSYHSNGHLYVATNGTAGGGNSPGVNYNAATNTYTQVSAIGIPGYAQSNGRDLTDQCRARDARDPNFVPRSVPAIGNHPTQRDTLYDVVQGGYYGHPNPQRCEFVLHEGNIDNEPEQWAGQGGSKYPVGVAPDANFKPIAYDFEYNKSPNGTIEYKSNTFGGQLKGRLAIVRFSNNNDIIWLQAAPDGTILGGQTEVGIPGIANTTMSGVGGFNDPLEIIENPANGNLYVNQYNLGGNQQKLFLLRVPANQQAAKIGVSKSEAVFSAVKSNGNLGASVSAKKTDAETFTLTNQSTESLSITSAITGANAAEFAATGVPSTLAPGASATVQLTFTPGTTVGQRAAQLTLTAGGSSVSVGLYGLSLEGIEGGNEPTFNNVVGTLGYGINVGWTNLAGGMQPVAKGDEVLEPLFVKSGTGSVTWRPLAHFAPPENLGFGWYTGNGTEAERRSLGGMNGTNTPTGGYQTLFPPVITDSTMAFDPGDETFGLYYYSAHFGRYGFTEDRLNSPASDAHRARIYPAKNRSGVLIPNTYIVAYEDASNGDYQDYVFLVSGIKPVTDTGSGSDAIKVDFTTAGGDLASGYIRDYGQAFGVRTGADQGSGLTYGWKDLATENDVNLSIGGTTPGNARDRNTSQPDVRLDSLMHMQPTDVPNFNGTNVDAFWEIALQNGTYQVTVGAGDPNVGSDPEVHQINLEGAAAIAGFVPSGIAGSSTRHSIATTQVEISDGFLTVDPIGGTNTKIGFIDIVPVSVDPGGDDPSDGAQVKVTFQTTGTSVPAGWTADTGAAYSSAAGYGWLDQATNQPVDRSNAARYRTTAGAGITFPSDARQQGFTIVDNSTVTTLTDGVWEYELPNGTYEVAASVGDAQYVDSVHRVLAEGQPVINGFVPTGQTPFQVGVRTVTVTDGRLSIASDGTNTKLNWVSIKGDGLGPVEPTVTAQIDFRPAGTTAPVGWVADNGFAYDTSRGFGWYVDGAPFDRSNMTRNRTAPAGGIPYPSDVKLQTLILMQNVTTTGTTITGGTVGTWEYALPSGEYEVTVSAGDTTAVDSVHSMTAEGQTLMNGFVPTTATPFATASTTVLVTDGRLTIEPTGVNTKMNWITISGTALADPAITVTANGVAIEDAYDGGAATIALSAAVASGATLESITYTLDGGEAQEYTAPFTIADPGTYTLEVTAVDSEDRTSSRTVEFDVLDIGGTLSLRNEQVTRLNGAPIPGLSEDVIVLHRVNSLTDNPSWQTLEFNDEATLTIENDGQKDLRITSMAISGGQAAQFEIVDAPMLPLLIEPGESTAVDVRFIANSGAKGVRTATLTIASSDPGQPAKIVQLRGGYMVSPEGNNELNLAQIISLYDWTTNVGTVSSGGSLGNGSENRTSPLNGDEVRSLQWKKLDSAKPVQARQLSAFHGCCGQTETININGQSQTHAGPYGQAIYPLKSNGLPVEVNTNPGGNFNITISGQNTAQPNHVAVKMWPIRDAAGKVVPGAWIAGHDYLTAPNQCGTGPTNCDYQDNTYLITNVLPVASSDTTAPAVPGSISGTADSTGVDLSWSASTDGDLAGYRVERASVAAGPWTTVSGTGLLTGTAYRDAAPLAIATTYYRVVAVDASGNATAGPGAAINTSSVTMAPLRFNAGGGAITVNGVTWAADPAIGTAGYRSYTNSNVTQISGTTDDALYFSTRSDNATSWGYDIPVPNGTYQVRLHFVEVYFGAPNSGPNNPDARRFSINIENGQTGRANYSILQDVGPTALDIEQFTATVTDGKVDIDFSASANQPSINAIEIIKVP